MKLPESLPWWQALVRHARGLTFIREYAGANTGEGVQACQKTTGNAPPDSWCCSFTNKCGADMFEDAWPLPHSGRCEDVRQAALKRGALVDSVAEACKIDSCRQGFTVATLDGGVKHAHHTFFVWQWLEPGKGFVTVEGNAADPKGAQSSDGNGAYWGRVRGNTVPVTFNGLTFKPDPREYHFVDFAKL